MTVPETPKSFPQTRPGIKWISTTEKVGTGYTRARVHKVGTGLITGKRPLTRYHLDLGLRLAFAPILETHPESPHLKKHTRIRRTRKFIPTFAAPAPGLDLNSAYILI